VNSYAVPFAVSVHGMEFNDSATHRASTTELNIEAVKLNEVRHGHNPKIIEARFKLQDSSTAFTVHCASRELHSSFNCVSPA
jgi:hypothetical protein